MEKSPPTTRKSRALNTMRAKGLGLFVLGLGLLRMALFTGQSALLAAYASAVRPGGWFALAAGVVLLCIHHISNARLSKLAKAHRQPSRAADAPTSNAPAPDGPATLRQIRDELKKKADAPPTSAGR